MSGIINWHDVTVDSLVQMIISESPATFISVKTEDDGYISILFHKDTARSVKNDLLEWEIVSYDNTFPWYIAAANAINGHFEVGVKAK